ncbi:MAG: YdcF family protein [Pseudomonadales bacterium]|nr:YdcF family protein [Pseudomonadales bacterium]
MPTHYFIVFGAAVKPDGYPSGTLQRRVMGAYALASQVQSPIFILTGGIGQYGPAEAEVMRNILLQQGVSDEQMIIEDKATDTMESAILCANIILRSKVTEFWVTVCSSPYHNYRCQMLLSQLGVSSHRGAMPSDKAALGVVKWAFYYFREAVAFTWDFIHILYLKTFNRGVIEDIIN